MLGERISNFELVRLLGEGRMGAVYEGKHPLIEKRVAIKLLTQDRSANPELVQRFLDEARAMSAIRHPNVVEVIDLGTSSRGPPYVVMELLEGETLGERLARVGKLELPVALDFASQTARALEAAHARGIVHRDLKPDNVVLVADPRLPGRELVKLFAFGIIKPRSELDATPVDTIAGAALATPSRLSQCSGVPEHLDHRADVCALGVMLHEMVCGAPPFVADGFGDMTTDKRGRTPPPSWLTTELPGEVKRTILRALARDQEERFVSMAELRGALEAACPPVALAADVSIDTERYVVRAFTGCARGMALASPDDQPPHFTRARAISLASLQSSAVRPEISGGVELAAPLDEPMTDRLARRTTETRFGRNDDAIAIRAATSASPRANRFVIGGLLCLSFLAASWLMQCSTTAKPTVSAKVANASAPALLDPAPQSRRTPASVPMTGVLPATTAGTSTKTLRGDDYTAKTPAKVAPGRGSRPATAETIAARSPVAPDPATIASKPLAVDTLVRMEEPPKVARVGEPQLVASGFQAKNLPEVLPARRQTVGAKAAASPSAEVRLAIVDLQVHGSLPDSEVRRGIERVRANFERCYRNAAASAGSPGRVDVRFELDELGHVQKARASGSTLAPLDRCVAEAMRNASSRRTPDTGIVRASFQLVPGR